jgi:hypothetical protein
MTISFRRHFHIYIRLLFIVGNYLPYFSYNTIIRFRRFFGVFNKYSIGYSLFMWKHHYSDIIINSGSIFYVWSRTGFM